LFNNLIRTFAERMLSLQLTVFLLLKSGCVSCHLRVERKLPHFIGQRQRQGILGLFYCSIPGVR